MFYENAKITQCKCQKQSIRNKIKIKVIITKTKAAAAAAQRKKRYGLYTTYHELLSEKWIVKRFRFHASQIISPQSVEIFAASHLAGCIEY